MEVSRRVCCFDISCAGPMDGDLDDLVARHATLRELREAALTKGFKPLAEDGIRRVMEGRTSLAEVSRVVDLTGRLR